MEVNKYMEYNNQTLIALLLGVALVGGILLRDQNIILTIAGALAGALTAKVSTGEKVEESIKEDSEPEDTSLYEGA